MIDGQNVLDQPVRHKLMTYHSIQKTETGQRDDYPNGCLLDYNDYPNDCLLDYNDFKNYYKMIIIDLSKQQKHDADPEAIKQINFTGNLPQQYFSKVF